MARPRKDLETMEFNGWEQLDALIVWASEEYCADKLGISIDTLAVKIKEKFGLSFPEYKKQKQEPMRINLMKKQYDVAMQGNVSMLIWLGKQYLKQSDKQEIVAKEASDEELLEEVKGILPILKRGHNESDKS
jgi:hypothetical protein